MMVGAVAVFYSLSVCLSLFVFNCWTMLCGNFLEGLSIFIAVYSVNIFIHVFIIFIIISCFVSRVHLMCALFLFSGDRVRLRVYVIVSLIKILLIPFLVWFKLCLFFLWYCCFFLLGTHTFTFTCNASARLLVYVFSLTISRLFFLEIHWACDVWHFILILTCSLTCSLCSVRTALAKTERAL